MTILGIAIAALVAAGTVCLLLVSFLLTVGVLRQFERTHVPQHGRVARQS